MKKTYLPRLVLFALSTALPVGSMAQGDPVAGESKAFTCMGCHGVPSYTNAYPTFYVPKLGGQHAPYIVSALKAYQSGERPHLTMHAQAVSLTEQDMQDIAAYFAQFGK